MVSDTDNWFIATPDNSSAENLLHMFHDFHDFRIFDVNYSAKNDSIDVVFEYDDQKLRVLLRFEGDVQLYIAPNDFEVDWIYGAALHAIDHQLRWINCRMDELDDIKPTEKITFFQGNRILWAIIDNEGTRLPIPEDILHQCWHVLNFETGKYETEYHDFTVTPL